ncbi:MAG: cytochrome c oxidase subunit II [Candidatus Binatia bacterium]
MLPWLPENISTYGEQIDSLFYLIFWITSITFVLVQAALLFFLFKYRAQPGRRATYTHGNNTLEIAWTIAPSLILIVIALMSRSLWHEIKQTLPPSKVHVQVRAKQFNWDITYPGPDGQFGTGDDKTLENDLNVPVDEVVQLTLQSNDVIHSFFIPVLRFKQDMLPGRDIMGWFEATKPGRYEIPCAELCGFGHSGMLGHLTVHSAEDYAKWVQTQWPDAGGGGAAAGQ